MITDDPTHPDINVPGPDGQNKAYLVLSEAERAKGFVRPYRNAYRHVGYKPQHPLRDLTQEERLQWGDEYVAFEAYPESQTSKRGRFWTQAELGARGCGAVTSMGTALSETYAINPKFYGQTFCVGCHAHFPVNQFVWDIDGEQVGS